MSYNETLARQVIAEVVHVTTGRAARWVTPQLIARRIKVHHSSITAAVRAAVDSGWLIAEGSPPHSICLTDAGRSQTAKGDSVSASRAAPVEAR